MSSGAGSVCVICFEPLTHELGALGCGHVLHAKCVVGWFRQGGRADAISGSCPGADAISGSCPVCRHITEWRKLHFVAPLMEKSESVMALELLEAQKEVQRLVRQRDYSAEAARRAAAGMDDAVAMRISAEALASERAAEVLDLRKRLKAAEEEAKIHQVWSSEVNDDELAAMIDDPHNKRILILSIRAQKERSEALEQTVHEMTRDIIKLQTPRPVTKPRPVKPAKRPFDFSCGPVRKRENIPPPAKRFRERIEDSD